VVLTNPAADVSVGNYRKVVRGDWTTDLDFVATNA
jgi:hypothetical protein